MTGDATSRVRRTSRTIFDRVDINGAGEISLVEAVMKAFEVDDEFAEAMGFDEATRLGFDSTKERPTSPVGDGRRRRQDD